MSTTYKIDTIFSTVTERFLSCDSFTESDIKSMLQSAKMSVLTVLAEQEERHMHPIMHAMESIPFPSDAGGDMCIPPNKNIRVHV